MTENRKSRRAGKTARNFAVAGAAVIGLVVGSTGTANAAVDDENHIVDGKGRTVTVQQADTFLDSVSPLDGNPLTREWFHNGRAIADVVGDKADGFKGKMTIGYQVAYPATLGGKLKFDWSTPGLGLNMDTSVAGTGTVSTPGLTVTNLVPQAGMGIEAGPGPGIKTVEVSSATLKGAHKELQIANGHGTVTGALGNVTLRPYVTLTSDEGDTVTTYGKPWTLN